MSKKKSVTFDSPTWQYVLSFAHEMEGKLSLNRHKGDREGWLSLTPAQLLHLLELEVEELRKAITICGSNEEIQLEAADVGNFAMMIHDQFRARELAKKV